MGLNRFKNKWRHKFGRYRRRLGTKKKWMSRINMFKMKCMPFPKANRKNSHIIISQGALAQQNHFFSPQGARLRCSNPTGQRLQRAVMDFAMNEWLPEEKKFNMCLMCYRESKGSATHNPRWTKEISYFHFQCFNRLIIAIEYLIY